MWRTGADAKKRLLAGEPHLGFALEKLRRDLKAAARS